MAHKQNVNRASYEVVTNVPSEHDLGRHALRSDNIGFRNTIATWWLFPFHLAVCGLLVVVVILWLDERQFNTGSPSNFFNMSSGLYQTQVNALLSLALVCIRLIAGACTALLIWRLIFIMLEKRGISLAEITRLDTWRIPLTPMGGSLRNILWSIWAILVILLLWPPGFSAPLASSSLAWVPSTRVNQQVSHQEVSLVDQFADYGSLYWNPTLRFLVVFDAATMTAVDPGYVLNTSTNGNTRRFFKGTLPTDSTMNVTAPYININLKWIDYTILPNYSSTIGNATYSDVNANGFSPESFGSVGIIRDSPANGSTPHPQEQSIFTGKKYIWVRLGTMNPAWPLEDGSWPNINTSCPTKYAYFGNLPNVKQYSRIWTWNDGTWVATDCFLAAEASITAGKQFSTGCDISSYSSNQQYATCTSSNSRQTVLEDWLTDLALEFTSEALKYTLIQNQTRSFMDTHSIDNYTIGTLALGYHSSWNALMRLLGNATESASYYSAESVVQAEIHRAKLYGWLGMNATLLISAMLVHVAQSVTVTKPIRDTALGAMTMDLNEIMHSDRQTSGLCNAVTLSKKDKKLPRMIWKRVSYDDPRKFVRGQTRTFDLETRDCHRRVTFLQDHERQTQGSALLNHEQFPGREFTRFGG